MQSVRVQTLRTKSPLRAQGPTPDAHTRPDGVCATQGPREAARVVEKLLQDVSTPKQRR
jgi:hypothetical protein